MTSKLISKSPINGKTVGKFETQDIKSLTLLFENAKEVQKNWSALSIQHRQQKLRDLREVFIQKTDEWIDLISLENGKPQVEALTCELIPTLDLLTFFSKKTKSIVKDKTIWLNNPVHWLKKSQIVHPPLGTILVISPWNFPLLLPMGDIIMGLVTGNAVIFKPSEVTPAIGMKIQETIDEAGFPKNIMQTCIGDGKLGSALIDQKPNKIFFTGSVSTGKKILKQASNDLIPVNLELGGKDPMIIMPDADLDFATSVALWGGFANSGQACASTERLIVHQSIKNDFLSLLQKKIKTLKPGYPDQKKFDVDLGFITFDKQKEVYRSQLEKYKTKNTPLLGGEFSLEEKRLQPTLVCGETIESEIIYQEESFGPIIAITTFQTPEEAIQKANDSHYGLSSSIITKNLTLADEMARKIEAGTVLINEVLYAAGIPEAPWGGFKNSGIGRTHSAHGLLDFVETQHIQKPRAQAFVFKSIWWFPYSKYQFSSFRLFVELYRNSFIEKLKVLPHFLWHIVQFIKNEKRL